MRAGRLRHRVTLQEKTVSGQNSYGEDTYTWTEVGTYSADVQPLTGREMEAVFQRFAEARFRVTIRYQDGVAFDRKRRLLWTTAPGGDRPLNILDAEDPTTRRREIVILAKEYVD